MTVQKGNRELDQRSVDTIRFLAVDMVERADSGHPGMPLGAAPMAYVLWARFLKHNPRNPKWFDRDRFVLSAGHGSALLYSLLHLTGYDLPMDQIQSFRQWESITPGHPESHVTPGVETTTGPLGQGFGNSVGMAIAEAHLAARYNRPGHEIIDHHTYVMCSDGDMMEGVTAEAASLAGHLKLAKLICFYDFNSISLAASTNVAFSEDVGKRFEAYGWQVEYVEDGNNLADIEAALKRAHEERGRPSLIIVRTHIGYGSPNKQDTYEAHGSPLGEEEVERTKMNLGWPKAKTFFIPDEVRDHLRGSVGQGSEDEANWDERFAKYARDYPDLAEELRRMMKGELPEDWNADIPQFEAGAEGTATRKASGQVLRAIADRLPNLFGGDADLAPSTYTVLNGLGDFQHPDTADETTQGISDGPWSYEGRNLHFGVREHAMGSICNGIAAHGGLIPFTGTFLIFSDYMRPPMRLAALMEQHVIYVFTHDSIGLGEDGPTHQPVEQLPSLRAIPGFTLIRPCDANEVAVAWQVAVEAGDHPVALIFTRQSVPTLDRAKLAPAEELRRGAYILSEAPAPREGASGAAAGNDPDLILIASGSEVHLLLEAQQVLSEEGVRARVVSMPSWELFEAQPEAYRRQVLPPNIRARLAVEAARPLGWSTYVGDLGYTIGVDTFGSSAPGKTVLKHYGFNVEHVVQRAREVLDRVQKVS
jgi:transketolase